MLTSNKSNKTPKQLLASFITKSLVIKDANNCFIKRDEIEMAMCFLINKRN